MMIKMKLSDDNIIITIRNLDINKAHGHDDITIQVISVTSW